MTYKWNSVQVPYFDPMFDAFWKERKDTEPETYHKHVEQTALDTKTEESSNLLSKVLDGSITNVHARLLNFLTDPIIEIPTHITPQQFDAASGNTINFNRAVKGPVSPHLHGNQVSSEPSTAVGTGEFPGHLKFLDDKEEEYLDQDEADASFNIVDEEANSESYDYESDDDHLVVDESADDTDNTESDPEFD